MNKSLLIGLTLHSLKGLKGSIKAKTFVLQLRDHLTVATSAHFQLSSPLPQSLSGLPGEEPLSVTFPEPLTVSSDIVSRGTDDAWALTYIDPAHLQPIIEAIDVDGSGYISVKEANKFASSRPKGWR